MLSYLLQRGRCRHCKTSIGAECLVSELAGGVLFAGLSLKYALGLELVMWLALECILLLLSLIDWNIRLLPDKLLLAAAANRVLFLFLLRQPLGETLFSMLIGAVSVSLPLLLETIIRQRMGAADRPPAFVAGQRLYAPVLYASDGVAGYSGRADRPESGFDFRQPNQGGTAKPYAARAEELFAGDDMAADRGPLSGMEVISIYYDQAQKQKY